MSLILVLDFFVLVLAEPVFFLPLRSVSLKKYLSSTTTKLAYALLYLGSERRTDIKAKRIYW